MPISLIFTNQSLFTEVILQDFSSLSLIASWGNQPLHHTQIRDQIDGASIVGVISTHCTM